MGDRLAGLKQGALDECRGRSKAVASRPAVAGAGNRALARLALQHREDAVGTGDLAERLQASRVGGQSLPADVASRLAPHIGPATNSIRVHADSNADALSRAVNATAFTTGRDIFFRSGAYQPRSNSGLQLLAHEATHVAQQAAGPVSGTSIGNGVSVSDPSDRFEREASSVAREFSVVPHHNMQRSATAPAMSDVASSATLVSELAAVLAVQRALIAPGQVGAGRLPAAEKVDLKALLLNNGFSESDHRKVTARRVHRDRLAELYLAVTETDAEIGNWVGAGTTNQNKRKKYKKKLEYDYDELLAYAEKRRSDAEDFFERDLDLAVTYIQGQRTKTGKIFKPEEKILRPFLATWLESHDDIRFFTGAEAFGDAVFKLIRQRAAHPMPTGMSELDKQQLADEKVAINAQLAIWNGLAANAAGCNENGTWGTSFGGIGTGWAVRRVTAPVWKRLRKWWEEKTGAFITPSDTTDKSLKMTRDPPVPGRSPRFNYHINITPDV